MTERKQFVAQPVAEKDLTSPWLTGRPKAVKAVRKVLGQSDYAAHAGCYTGGANGVYWVDIIDKRPDGLVLVANITEGAKRKVESVQMAIEPDLLYPLLRGRDVKRWQAKPSAYILMAQDPEKRQGISEDEMKTSYPKTYQHLKRFEAALRERAAYKRYFRPEAPFYSMFDVGDYTLAPYKVVWRYVATDFISSVVGNMDAKPIVPNEKLMLISCDTSEEAHYICAMCNSSPARFIVISYGVGTQLAPHLLKNIRIPKFDPADKVHQELASLSHNAHHAVSKPCQIGDETGLEELEQRIDELAAQIWGLTAQELREIRHSLKELQS
jgi:hypothetical protein